jgi:glycosyltransferase involved in cell wall biosynthesis
MPAVPPRGDSVDLSVFVPCFNEEKLILKTLDTIRDAASRYPFSYEVLIYDDGSRDRSPALIRNYIDSNGLGGQFELISDGKNHGIGTNYFRAAERGRGEYFIVFFGDNSEPVESMTKMFDLMGKADVIIPYIDSRVLATKFNTDHRSIFRRLISILFATLVRFLSGHKIRYFNGFVLHRRQNVVSNRVGAYGFGFQAELLCRVLDDPSVSYLEVKVSCAPRAAGFPTVFRFRNLVSVLGSFWRILARRWFHSHRS